jgi:ribosome-binding factor A
MAQFRTERLGQTIQEKISSLILEGRIKDRRVNAFLSITRVDVSKDLSLADVYVSDIRSKDIEKGASGLQSAAGFIQTQLAASLRVRKIPHLRFHADTGISDGFDMIKKIEKLTAQPGEQENTDKNKTGALQN